MTALEAAVADLLRGALVVLWLLFGAYVARELRAFHQSGMRRLRHQQEDAPVPRLRPGQRELTPEEARELRRRQRALEEAAEAWLSPAHREATARLQVYAAKLADDHVPLSRLGETMGVRKQRAHQQVQAGRDRLGAPS